MSHVQANHLRPAHWSDRGTNDERSLDGIEYATTVEEEMFERLSPEAQQALKDYKGLLDVWTGNDNTSGDTTLRSFVDDAVAVDSNLEERLRLVRVLASETALDHPMLARYKAYVVADRAAITRPDPDKEAYEAYMERRADLRDRLGLQSLRISAAEYQELTKRIQGAIATQDEAHIPMQRDYIALRKEIAQENARHPRFVAEVAHNASGTLFDELLVDLDRDDLRTTGKASALDIDGQPNTSAQTNTAWLADSRMRAEIFSAEIAKRAAYERTSNGAGRVRAYVGMIEMGKQIVSDPVAIKEFAAIQMDKVAEARLAERGLDASPEMAESQKQGLRQLGGKDYEIGIAALENKPFSSELTLSFFETIGAGYDLPAEARAKIFGTNPMIHAQGREKALKNLAKRFPPNDTHLACQAVARDPVKMFQAAHAAFVQQFDAGDPNAGLSFAVMEHMSVRMLGDPDLVARLATDNMDAAMALQQFDPETRQQVANRMGGDAFEKMVYDRLVADNKVLTQSTPQMMGIAGEQVVSEDGATIDLAERMRPQNAQVIAYPDGRGGLRVAVSEAAVRAGEFVVLSGPFRRPETKEEIDARIEADNEARAEAGLAPLTKDEEREYHKAPQIVPVDLGQHARPKTGEDGKLLPMDPFILHAAIDKDGNVSVGETPEGVQAGKGAFVATSQMSGEPVGKVLDAVHRDGPYLKVLEGGRVAVAATKADMEAGRGVEMNLYGINVPPPGKGQSTKDDMYDAGNIARDHLQEILERHGTRGMEMKTVEGRDGQKELQIRLNTQEDLSMRMIRDGYALPSECDLTRTKREHLASDAERNGRGIWKHGFPEDNGQWRSASLMPHLSRRDRNARLTANVNMAYAGNASHAARIFSDKAARLFAMPIGERWDNPAYMREALEAVHMNPQRMKKLYEENLKVMEDLRKRHDDKDSTKKLTNSEKVAHDKLCVGAHLVGMALVRAGERYDPKTKKVTYAYGITPADVEKGTSRMLSERGLKISEGMKYTLSRMSEKGGKAAEWAGQNSKQFFDYLVNVGDQFTR